VTEGLSAAAGDRRWAKVSTRRPSPTGIRRNPPDERAVRVLDEPRERLLHFVQGGKGVQTIGALAYFAGALGSAQQQDGQDGALARLHAQHVLEAVFEFRGAAAEGLFDEVFLRKSAKGFRNFLTGEVGDGVAAGGLVAGDEKGVVGERVAAGSEDVLFQQATENTGFLKGELDFREVLHGRVGE